MKRNKVIAILMSLVLIFALAGCSAPAPQTPAQPAQETTSNNVPEAQEFTLILGHGAPEGTAADLWSKKFKEVVEAKSQGKIKVDLFPTMQLGSDREMVEGVQAGDISIVLLQTAPAASFVPELAVFDLPNVFSKYDAATIDRALNKSAFTDLINEAYAKAGFVNLGYLQGGTFRETSSNKNITKLEDFKGLKIRTMENKYHMAYWQALGANPTPVIFAELYMALQQGLVEAEENAYDTMFNAKFMEVQKYVINTHHLLYLNQFIMNKELYEKMPADYQKIMDESVAEATADVSSKLGDFGATNLKALTDAGMKVVDFTPEMFDQMIEKAKPVYDMIRTDIGDKLVDTLLSELAK
ncbi:MAG: tripartite ATP-independent periplasmic transporter solute receptor, DctP family [Clostridia bacterium]|jgi:tripartite ATP-independent transporter DctP family solute receptor|nr:tripartite ATP-independent periplasmic transporter solute receptor, DctP family [Clostridia bacterium]